MVSMKGVFNVTDVNLHEGMFHFLDGLEANHASLGMSLEAPRP